MTICPVAIAVGCKRCPVFRLCPVKGFLGDVGQPAKPANAEQQPPATPPAAEKKRSRPPVAAAVKPASAPAAKRSRARAKPKAPATGDDGKAAGTP